MVPALRVGVVEDDAQLRDAFASLIGDTDGMACIGAFASAEAAIDGLRRTAIDVVLMDINLPGINGIECIRRLRAAKCDAQFIMLTTFDDATTVFESLQAGATGYVLKRSHGSEIVSAIREVGAGGAPMSGAIARKVVQFFGERAPAQEVQTLTPREREVLLALSQGQQYKEIADALSISINTVRKYIRDVYQKLHVNTRLEAVKKLGGA